MKEMNDENREASAPRRLPSVLDISPSNGMDLDERTALKHFHGLTQEQATALLRENPLHYLEDFFYMGPVAFAFYVPAVLALITEGGLGEPDGGEWDAVVSVAELRLQFGILPLEMVPVMLDCIGALAVQLPVREYWPGEYAKMAKKLERVRAKLAALSPQG